MTCSRRRFLETGGIITTGLLLSADKTLAMDQKVMTAADELKIVPSKTSSEKDFDFLVGAWNIKNRKLKTRLKGSNDWLEFDSTLEMRKILNGIANVESFKATFDGNPFEGMAVRLFNPTTRLWSVYWADSNDGVLDKNPVVGSFDGGVGKFFAKDIFNGKEITVLYQWDRSDPEHPLWSQAFSTDNGKTWEWNWYMTASRQTKMFDHVRFAEIPVTNQDRALTFYTEKIGMTVFRDGKFSKDWRWIELSIPGAETRMLFSKRPDENARVEPNVFLVASDFKKTYESLKAKGVNFIQEPKKEHWGQYALFRDSENNIVQLDSGKE